MKKIISLFIVAVFMLTALVACNEGEDFYNKNNQTERPTSHLQEEGDTEAIISTESPTENPTEEPTEGPTGGSVINTDIYQPTIFDSAVPKGLDFEGEDLFMLVRSEQSYTSEWEKEVPEDTVLDMAIQMRNEQVAEELNLVFRLEHINNIGGWDQWVNDMNTTIVFDITSQTRAFDMYSHSALAASSLAIRGCQANLLNMEIFPYFDFNSDCWNKALVNQAINGKLLYVAGALNLSLYDKTVVTWHNKTMYDRFKTSDDPEDMQDVALDGNFTFDELYRWSQLFENAGTESACDNKYGISPLSYAFYEAVPYAWDIELIKTEPNGTHSWNLVDNKSAENAITELRYLREQKGVSNCQNDYYGSGCYEGMMRHFANGQLLFMMNALYPNAEGNLAIREMQDKYAVLPLPKYSAEQKQYGTTALSTFNLVSALNHTGGNVRGEAISAYFQRATELSYTDVLGVYVESVVRPRYFGLDDGDGTVSKSIAIIDDILRNIKFDRVSIYGTGIGDIRWDIGYMVEKTNDTFYDAFTTKPIIVGGTNVSSAERLEMLKQQLRDFDNYILNEN